MSWPLAAFLIVAIVLAVGWLAYERRRPSARMAAVVAVMAALAALGRDAFAALPDVKPITAMTLVVGYALGPIPGFTVALPTPSLQEIGAHQRTRRVAVSASPPFSVYSPVMVNSRPSARPNTSGK